MTEKNNSKYRLLLVEDDALILEGLSNINWDRYGFDLVGALPDGELALERLNKVEADIVVTDINMPYLGGLELTKRIHEKDPSTIVILMTGYETFEYAKEAVSLNVFDFLLKPVKEETLLSTLRQSVRSIERHRQIQQQVVKSIPLLRRQFLEELLRHKMSGDEVQERIAFLKMEPFSGYCTAAVFELDDYGNREYRIMEKELLCYGAENIAREILEKEGYSALCLGNGQQLSWIISGGAADKLLSCLELVRQSINTHLNSSITIGVGEPCGSVEEICVSYKQAQLALSSHVLVGQNTVIPYYPGLEQELGAGGEPLEQLGQELCKSLKLGMIQNAVESLDELEKHVRIQESYWAALWITTLICKTIGETQDLFQGMDSGKQMEKLAHALSKSKTVPKQFEVIRSFLWQLPFYTEGKSGTGNDSLIEQAKAFLRANFSDSSLSLSVLARQVHTSPVYLSSLFKRKQNINFSEYLLNIRIEEACRMLRQTGEKTYNIAEMVGIPNAQYFSICFKKRIGCSPSEYRSKLADFPAEGR